MFFGSKMVQTKHKPLRKRDFLKFSARECTYIWNILILKTNTSNRILLRKSNTQILEFLKAINTI